MNAVQKVSYTHDAMIDLMIARPSISNNELARHFGYTPAWVSMIRSSDAFKARLSARRGELVDPTITATLDDRIRAVTERSLEVIAEKLEQPVAFIPDALVMRAVEFGAKALGIGREPPPPPPDEGRLARIAARLTALNRAPGESLYPAVEVVDVESKEVPSRNAA